MNNIPRICPMIITATMLCACGAGSIDSSSAIASLSSASSTSSSAATSSSTGSGVTSLIVAINAGGNTPANYDGIDYQADKYAKGGTTNSTGDSISGADGALFNSERYGAYTYEIPVSSGTYSVRLHFAEIYHESSGQRIIDAEVEGGSQVDGVDLYQIAGHDTPYSVDLDGIAVTDGKLSIEIAASKGDGTLAGFAVFSSDGALVIPERPDSFAKTVENTGIGCAVADLPDADALAQNSKFPDPFLKLDGTRLTKKSEWLCKRQEIHKQAEKYIYGEKPPKPDVLTGTVTNSKVSVHVEHNGKKIDFSADIVLPSTGQAPYPAIINLGQKGGFGGITLGESRILSQGVAVIYYNHYELGVEGPVEASRGLANPGKFYDLYGGFHSAGLLMSWAWGASRILDVLEQAGSDIIDMSGIGVTGCSRNGKGAFTVGVFDERIALTIPHETSTGGVPALRIVDVLNTERTDHNYYGLNWLSNNFEPFVLNANQLPIDTHSLVAMVAPRGLLVLDNPHQKQFSAPAGHTAAVAGLEVYKALGVADNLSYHSNVSDTAHCSYKNEYTTLLNQNIAKFLKHEDADTGTITVGSGGSGNISQWVDWTAPTLAE